jgi:hypothetical protein
LLLPQILTVVQTAKGILVVWALEVVLGGAALFNNVEILGLSLMDVLNKILKFDFFILESSL